MPCFTHTKGLQHQQHLTDPLSAGEFEPHTNAWMGWPDSGYLWREDAKPAQKQYTEVAKAISQFEPVVIIANPEVEASLP